MFPAKLPCQLRSGQILNGKYRIEEELGSGGFGCVYAAENLNLHTRVAIKLRREPGPDARLWREAQLAAGLRSPNSVRIFDVDRLADGTPYIVMEFLRGRTLREYLRDARRAPVERAVQWVLQVCSALSEAHAAGLVHRDIKPSNLFLVETGESPLLVKLVDFGLAKQVEAATSDTVTDSGVVVGSPAYMAPERVRAGVGTAQTDIWSVGVVLFEMLTGELPFEGATNSAMLASIVADPPRPLREVAPESSATLGAIIARCLRKRPEDRYVSVEALAQDLRQVEGHAPVRQPHDDSVTASATLAKQPPGTGAERRGASRRRLRFIAGLVAVPLVGVPLMAWLFSLLGAPNARVMDGARSSPAPPLRHSAQWVNPAASASAAPSSERSAEALHPAPRSSDPAPTLEATAGRAQRLGGASAAERATVPARPRERSPAALATARASSNAAPRLFAEPDF